MTYTTFRPFNGMTISGNRQIPQGAKLDERGGFLFYRGKLICAVTSENGWEHFRPDTIFAAHRQDILENLYEYYQTHEFDVPEPEGTMVNRYWKNILRTIT